ncbi:hypothetical protein JXO52_01695 [bacterium]|nr:hypothetical protein [bacterium]
MMVKTHKRLRIAVLAILTLGFGLWLYTLIPIPFGALFTAVQVLFIISCSLLLLSTAVQLFRNGRPLIKAASALPVLLGIGLFVGAVIVNTGYRMIYFRGIPPNPGTEEWREDLYSLAAQLQERHADLNALISPVQMQAAVKQIEKKLPQLNDGEAVMALFSIAALPNDCHTFPFIMMPAYKLHSFPFRVFVFPDGVHIVDAGREYRHLIGARVVSISGRSMENIYDTCPLLLAAENESSYKERFTYMVMMPEWLQYHGIIDDVHKAVFTLERVDGTETEITIPSLQHYAHFLWSGVFPVENDAPPVFASCRKDYYRYTLSDDSTLYIQFNQCEDQPGRETMALFTANMKNAVSGLPLARCVVDIRSNDGGNPVWRDLVDFLRDDPRFSKPGAIRVLIGRRTFSSAVMFATQLQLQTPALFFGEPTGQGPIFYGGPRFIELPNSGLPFAVAGHHTVAGMPFDNRSAIMPDVPVAYTIDDFLEGKDPVMQAALEYRAQESGKRAVPPLLRQQYTGRYLFSPVEVLEVSVFENELMVTAGDFIPESYFRFRSILYPLAERGAFSTDIPGVTLRFTGNGGSTDAVVLNWMGEQILLQRAAEGFKPATELFALGDVRSACDAIREDPGFYTKHLGNVETMLNRLGYDLLKKEEIRDALDVFQLNVDLHPDSWNVYDSYAEGLLRSGDRGGAIANYRKSLELNPESASGKRALAELDQ